MFSSISPSFFPTGDYEFYYLVFLPILFIIIFFIMLYLVVAYLKNKRREEILQRLKDGNY